MSALRPQNQLCGMVYNSKFAQDYGVGKKKTLKKLSI
jgi:hypothetical protein